MTYAPQGAYFQGDNGGIAFAHQPIQQLIANLTANFTPIGRLFNVWDHSAGGEATTYWADPVRIAQMDARYVNDPAWANVCILLETADYVDDVLGAAGSGLALTNPTAAGQADYDAHVLWAQRMKAAHTAWLPVPVCPPDLNEPSTYASSSDNAQYRLARNHSNALKLADTTNFWRVIDAYSNPAFNGTLGPPYYQNAGLGQWIHLTETGADLLGLIEYQGIV